LKKEVKPAIQFEVQLVARTHPFRKAGAAVGIGIVCFFFPLFISMFNAGLKKKERECLLLLFFYG
jgi:hypothetical protein